MTHTLHTHIKTENFEKDDYMVYLTRDLAWVARNALNQRTPYEPIGAWGPSNLVYDPVFMQRLADFLNNNPWVNAPGNMWADIYEKHQFFLNWLQNGELEQAHDHLNLMHQSPLMHGITQGDHEFGILQQYPVARNMRVTRTWDIFLGVMEYSGLIGPQNHEQGASFVSVPVDVFLNSCSDTFRPPRWQGGLWGLQTNRGIFGDRDLMSFYIAQKIKEKFPTTARIVEIGGGGGYTAYWLYQLGFRNITMIDIPTVAACQAYQLAANIGPDAVCLPHETHAAPIKFITPEQFNQTNETFDLVVNCDSMPEMDKDSLNDYLDTISRVSGMFYSINQECRGTYNDVMQHVVRSVIKEKFPKISRMDRSRFWLRDGYAEEWYVIEK